MTRYSTLHALLILVLTVFSCTKNDLSPEESASLHTTCGVKNPVKELPWLKAIIDHAEKGPDKGLYAGTILQVTYQDQAYFIYQKYHMSCMACEVYDCQGNKPDILANPDLHMALIERMSEKNIIYRSPMN
jgi:hypothetical protein